MGERPGIRAVDRCDASTLGDSSDALRMSELEVGLRSAMAGDVRADAYTRHLYSTDASMYSIEPLAVVFPRDAAYVAAAVDVYARRRVPMLPVGAENAVPSFMRRSRIRGGGRRAGHSGEARSGRRC